MNQIKCKNCKFYEIDLSYKVGGDCCRYPPSVEYSKRTGSRITLKPFVNSDDYCGEFVIRSSNLHAEEQDCE